MRVVALLFLLAVPVLCFAQVDEEKLQRYSGSDDENRPSTELQSDPKPDGKSADEGVNDKSGQGGGFSWDRMRIGGGFGLSGGSNFLAISASPMLYYMVTDWFMVGPGFSYQYLDVGGAFPYTASIYGPTAGMRFNLGGYYIEGLGETLKTDYFDPDTNRLENGWVPGLFVGGGFQSRVGARGFFSFGLLYNVLYDEDRSPYSSAFVPVIGIFF